MIGSVVLRCAHYVIAIGADDMELRDGMPSRWRVTIVLLGEGMRVEVKGTLEAGELAHLADDLDDLASGRRTAASLESEDGTLYLSFEPRGDGELAIAIRMVRDPGSGLYSTAETTCGTSFAQELATGCKTFPY